MQAHALCLKYCSIALGESDVDQRTALKYIVVIVVVLLGVWLWRKNRADAAQTQQEEKSKPARRAPSNAAEPQVMLSCAVCGVHLPRSDATVGRRGSYCSVAHQKQLEG